MTQWIASLLKRSGQQHTVANVISDGLSLQLVKVSRWRMHPPYLLLLDLRSPSTKQWVRVAEIRGDTPQACAALFGQIVSVARQNIGATT
jgi:hypothetical protein